MNTQRCFEILKLNSDASLGEVNQAYRDMVNIWHPDRFAHNPRLKQKVEEQLKEINIARDILLKFFSLRQKGPESKAEAWVWGKAGDMKSAEEKRHAEAKARAGTRRKTEAEEQANARVKAEAEALRKAKADAKTKTRTTSKKDTIRDIEDKINRLPLIDVTVLKVISLLDNPESNFEQIVEHLSPDIAVRFLSMASSAYYGREVQSINYAVRLLGYSEMKKLLITSILLDHFTRRLKEFSFNKFQKQAQFCAVIAQVLGKIIDYAKKEDLFTVGMLHNIGKLVLAVYFKDKHREIISLKKSEGLTTSDAEQKIMGVTHAEIGSLVLKRFNIPPDICSAVRLHDNMEQIIPGKSGFQLALVLRESAKIVSKFTLPKEMEPRELLNQLKGTVAKGEKILKDGMRSKVQTKGYNKIIPALLEQASSLVYEDLKKHLNERIPQNGDEENS